MSKKPEFSTVDQYDKLTLHILSRASVTTPARDHLRIAELSSEFFIPDIEVEEVLARMHSDRLIDVAAWDGHEEKSLDAWQNPRQVFHSPADPGRIRVRISVEGQRKLVDLRSESEARDRRQIFISHIAQEKPVALKLKEYLQKAFGPDLAVFVSSDLSSIGGGRKWFEHIITNLRSSHVVLVLVSQESAKREWINFEAGFGDGAGATVIPVAIKDFTFSKLTFPLAGYNGREVGDIESILFDIRRETGMTSTQVDALEYREEVRAAEASLIYKQLVVRPVVQGGNLRFSVANVGNIDLDLIMIEAWAPGSAFRPPGAITVRNLLYYRQENLENDQYFYCRYTSQMPAEPHGVESLMPVLTPSMGAFIPEHPVFALNKPLKDLEDLNLYYHIHARGYDTRRETITIRGAAE